MNDPDHRGGVARLGEDMLKIMGIRVISPDGLPEGILMFVKDGVTVGMLDNRKDRTA